MFPSTATPCHPALKWGTAFVFLTPTAAWKETGTWDPGRAMSNFGWVGFRWKDKPQISLRVQYFLIISQNFLILFPNYLASQWHGLAFLVSWSHSQLDPLKGHAALRRKSGAASSLESGERLGDPQRGGHEASGGRSEWDVRWGMDWSAVFQAKILVKGKLKKKSLLNCYMNVARVMCQGAFSQTPPSVQRIPGSRWWWWAVWPIARPRTGRWWQFKIGVLGKAS